MEKKFYVLDHSFFGLIFNSKSGVFFTSAKDFFKLLFGVKITAKQITPL